MATNIVEQPTVEVWITAVVEREFRRRDVFPGLRIEHALRVMNGSTGVHLLSIEDAEALLDEAEKQCANRLLARGLPMAFGSLHEKLQANLKHAKGLWDDPGIEVMRERMQESPAQFQVGDRVRFYSQWVDGADDGKELVIVEGYSLRCVSDDEGEFLDKNGDRRSYRWGYAARNPRTDERCFYSAGELQHMDYTCGHLRLVGERPAKHGWRRQG